MNERQFIPKLRKLLGRNAAYRIDPLAPDAETRAGYRSVLPELRAAENEARAELDARRAELLKDPVYQALLRKWQDAKQLHAKALGKCYRYRVTAGVGTSIALLVKAEGDSLAEILEKLEQRKVAA